MGLKDYKPLREEIKLKSTALSLRGLTMPDVTRLISLHLPEIETAFGRWKAVQGQVYARTAADEFFIGLCSDFPEVVSEVISVACDEEDAKQQASKLPVGVQCKCLEVILRLSFEEAGGIKNWFASLVGTLRGAIPDEVKAMLAAGTAGMTTTTGTAEPQSKPSIGDSDET